MKSDEPVNDAVLDAIHAIIVAASMKTDDAARIAWGDAIEKVKLAALCDYRAHRAQ